MSDMSRENGWLKIGREALERRHAEHVGENNERISMQPNPKYMRIIRDLDKLSDKQFRMVVNFAIGMRPDILNTFEEAYNTPIVIETIPIERIL